MGAEPYVGGRKEQAFFWCLGQGLTVYPWLARTQEVTSVCLLSAEFKGMPFGAQQEKVS